MAKKLIERKDIPAEERWDLERIYKDSEAWEADFNAAAEEIKLIPAFENHLTDSADTLLRFLKTTESLELKLDDLYVYAKMKLDEDNRINRYQGMRDRAMALMVKASEAMAFYTPEILAAGEDRINELLAQSDALKGYERAFRDILRYAPHTLSKEQEELLAMSGEMAENAQNTFTMFNEADLKFPTIKDEDGDDITITHGNFIRLMESKDRAVREAAFKGLYSSYGSYRNTVAATLSGSVKKDVFYAKVRKYPSALNEALFADAVDETLYDGLINAVRDNLDAFHSYLKLRKEVLGVDELHFYDVYTPLVADADRKIPFEEGFEIVKKALAPLGEEYIGLLQQAKDNRWMDVRENEGKTSGAYSWGVYNTDPYVLMSYQDNLNSVFTMAHELGHSLHSYYSWHNQPYQYAYYRIFVAEVASTVNETLLADYMLKTSKDDREKAFLLNQYLEEFRGTVYRQTMFGEFEKIIHQRAEAMETLTADDFCEIYLNLNKDYFGDAIVYDDEIALEWSRIPHFYNAFYVYKYATSFAAAQYLANRILSGDPQAKEDYINFLKGGCSDDPNELLKKAGVDLTDPATIPGIFAIFRKRLEELGKILVK
ncbi:MAG: oligoendopeptidase F [Firmicutes bacterium]|nr:oligoendopeptidase F [Bacillota bacterium]